MGIAYGLDVDNADVKMHSLQPYDTRDSLGYITTLAMMYIPADMVNSLSLSLNTAVSTLYDNPNNSTKTLMNLINPVFPIVAGESLDEASGAAASATASALAAQETNNAAPLSASTVAVKAPVRASSVGIGVGVVASAAAYGAAMFYFARRYKMRRQAHMRVPSVVSNSALAAGPAMSQTYGSIRDSNAAGLFMSGARSGPVVGARGSTGNPFSDNHRHVDTWHSRGSGFSSNGRSVREAGISAPMMAENSLGWH